MKIKKEYLDQSYHINGREINLRFLDKNLYAKYQRIIPEAFEEETEKTIPQETSFEKTKLWKKITGK